MQEPMTWPGEFGNTEVTYRYPRPGEDKTPVEKVGLVTKVAGYTCVVGYYKQIVVGDAFRFAGS